MSRSLGDFATSTVVYGKFTTYRPSTGAPFTLAGTPALSVYKDNSTTQSTTGVTLTVDFDAVTGLHHFAIDTSADGTFYSAGSFFDIVITAGTVDSVSAVGTVVGSFTLAKSAAFARLGAPAGASISADIAAVQSDTNDIQTRIPAALVSGRMDASVGAMAANTLTASALATDAVDEIVDAVWDESLTAATHNVANSSGRRLRQLSSVVIHEGTAQAGSTINTVVLDTGASATDGAYDPGLVVLTGGTGQGQARQILQYTGSTRVAVVGRDWRTTPDNTSTFQILAYAGTESVNEGLAQGGTSTTITLNAGASADDDAYNGQICFIRSGTGADHTAVVTDYNGTTKVATIYASTPTGEWSVIPDTTSAYVMVPSSPVVLAGINHVGAEVSISAGGIASTSFAAGAIDNAAIATDAIGASEFAQDAAQEIADEVLNRNLAGGGSGNTRNVRNALRSLRNRAAIAAGTLTVYQEDDSTAAWTAAVTTTAGDPVSEVDPT